MAQDRRFTDGGTPKTFFSGLRAPTLGYRRKRLAEWALSLTQTENRHHVFVPGCSGGSSVLTLLKVCPKAKVAGVDPSQVAIEKAGRMLKEEVEEGRCELICSELEKLPLRSRAFELAVSPDNIETYPEGALKEVYRVLKPRGILLVYALDGERTDKAIVLQEVMKAGFSEIRDFSDSRQGYIGIVACKR
ncbi:MAG: class I SAM-dependent methyltransferase [Erysipelotrichaceae bacterium]|nr:class I SAM-dependent methyltransferase [Erysipelotrichaceae bacterium]MBR3168542.1 class I SAM-dependent methyltransferase [Erysipelotrichaceae bacterium]